MHAPSDTIVALSSPPLHALGQNHVASIAIIRLSGSRAAELGDAVFRCNSEYFKKAKHKPVNGSELNLVIAEKSGRWWRIPGTVKWNAHSLRAHVYLMPAPKSYTRETVVELHVPGMKWLVDALLEALVSAGARLAQPGEFTRRAFSNGRITLEQAEAVGRLIRATTTDEARAFAGRLASRATQQRQELRGDLERFLAQLELGLDFAHEDVVVIERAEVGAALARFSERAERLAADARPHEERNTALGLTRILLVGPTNAGKSRLFNALLGNDVAIVSSQRHATRDQLEGVLVFENAKARDNLSAVLVDTAGSGSAETALTEAAQASMRRALRTADVVLLTIDASAPDVTESFNEIVAAIRDAAPPSGAVLFTKSDLPRSANVKAPEGLPFTQALSVSALTGSGVPELRAFLRAEVERLNTRAAQAHVAASAAVSAAAGECHAALQRALAAWREGLTGDVLAVDVREALHALWRCEGLFARHDAVTEGALDLIFAEFCIGK